MFIMIIKGLFLDDNFSKVLVFQWIHQLRIGTLNLSMIKVLSFIIWTMELFTVVVIQKELLKKLKKLSFKAERQDYRASAIEKIVIFK